MNLDQKLTQLGLKMKQVVLMDLSFPQHSFPEFKSAYPHRFVHVPGMQGLALSMASGLASFGHWVLLYGYKGAMNLPDETLHIKCFREKASALWDDLEADIEAFGPGLVLIPPQDSSNLE